MNDRTVPFELDLVCDNCGAMGAYDFMGDYLCPACTLGISETPDEYDYVQDDLNFDANREKE